MHINPMNSPYIKTVIVDDEKPARQALFNFLRENCPSIEIVAECNSASSAYKAIVELQPQLVFLDIEMPNGNGFDLLKMFKSIHFKIIFITAFSEYAVQAFRYSAVDYLLKPIKVSELIEAINKVKNEITINHSSLNLQTLLNNIYSLSDERKSLVIPNSKDYSVIKTCDIIVCKADGYCTNFQLVGNVKICSSRNLKFYEDLLPKSCFLRVHRSYLVNKQHIKSFNILGQIFLSEGMSCNLSNSYKQSFYKAFKQS